MNKNKYNLNKCFRDKSNWFIIVLFFVSSLVLLVTFSYKDTILHDIDMSFKYSMDAKSLLVSPSSATLEAMTTAEYNNYKYDYEKIKRINHVDVVTFYTMAVPVNTSFKSELYDGAINLDYASSNIVKQLTGENLFKIDDYGVAICPKKFYPGSYRYENIDKLKFYDDSIIGKTFTATYDIYSRDVNNKLFVSTQKTKKFKIVGLYDSTSIQKDFNICYIGGNEYEEIVKDAIIPLNSENGGLSAIRIVVDNAENVEYVKDELSKIDLDGEVMLVYDYERVANVKLTALIMIAILLIFIILVSELYIRKKLVKNSNDIKLLYCLGFSKKEISKIYISNLLLILIISFVAAIFGFIMTITFNEYIPIHFSRINILSFLITISIIFMIPVIVNMRSLNKLSKNQKFIIGENE